MQRTATSLYGPMGRKWDEVGLEIPVLIDRVRIEVISMYPSAIRPGFIELQFLQRKMTNCHTEIICGYYLYEGYAPPPSDGLIHSNPCMQRHKKAM